jgi:hypothetical protein
VADEEVEHLLVRQLGEETLQTIAPVLIDLAEDARAGVGGVDEDDPPIVGAVPAFDQSARVHPVDDPGHARDRDVELLRQLPHRQRAVRLEDGQDVEVDQTEAAALPPSERAHELARVPGEELVEEGVGQLPSAGRRQPILRRGADIQWHVDSLRRGERWRNG